MNNITIRELLNELEKLDMVKLVKEKREYDRYVSKSRIYKDVDYIIKDYIEKRLDIVEEVGVHDMMGNGNIKDRYVEVKRIIRNKNGYVDKFRFLFYIRYSITVYKIYSEKWGLKSIEIKQSFDDEWMSKTIEDIIKEDIKKVEDAVLKNKNVELPKHIENSKLLFDRILKTMEAKEKISWSDGYDLKKVVEEYNNLMEFK